jgi:hypothetical protein
MKTLKLLIPAIAVLALLQGCTKEYITKQYITQEYNGAQVYARDYTVKQSDWKRNEGENNPGFDNYLYAEFDNPDITKDVVDNGTVQAFIYTIYNVEENLGSWNPLPFVYPLLIEEKDDSGNVVNSFIVAENTRFEYNVGKVTFIIQDLDGINPLDIANEMSIRVCVTI